MRFILSDRGKRRGPGMTRAPRPAPRRCAARRCVRNAWRRAGFRKTARGDWCLYWGKPFKFPEYKDLGPFQKARDRPRLRACLRAPLAPPLPSVSFPLLSTPLLSTLPLSSPVLSRPAPLPSPSLASPLLFNRTPPPSLLPSPLFRRSTFLSSLPTPHPPPLSCLLPPRPLSPAVAAPQALISAPSTVFAGGWVSGVSLSRDVPARTQGEVYMVALHNPAPEQDYNSL